MASRTFTSHQVCQTVTGEDGDMVTCSLVEMVTWICKIRKTGMIQRQTDSERQTDAEMKQAYDTLLDAEDSPPSSQSRMNSDNSESDYRTG